MIPRITAVVPCYNDGATVQETVKSLLAHKEPLEILVVNDGSTDAYTLEVFEILDAKEGVRVLHKENGGLSSARMFGTNCAQGKYIFPLDADDLLADDTIISRMADRLDNSDLSVIWGDYQTFGNANSRIFTAHHMDAWAQLHFHQLPVCALFSKKLLLEDTEGWQLKPTYEDWDCWLSIIESGAKGEHIDEVVFLYRLHGVRMHAEGIKKHEKLFAIIQQRHAILFANKSTLRKQTHLNLLAVLTIETIWKLPITNWKKTLWSSRIAIVTSPKKLRQMVKLKRALSKP